MSLKETVSEMIKDESLVETIVESIEAVIEDCDPYPILVDIKQLDDEKEQLILEKELLEEKIRELEIELNNS